MPETVPLTVYVDLLNVEEVTSMIQDAATEIGALREAAEAMAEALRGIRLYSSEDSWRREALPALARWEAVANDGINKSMRRLDPDAPAPPLEGGDWGFAEDLDDGRMGEPSGVGDGAER
jgi:hypothetical protein